MKGLLVFLLCLVVVLEAALAEKCNEEDLKKCVLSLEDKLINQIDDIKKGLRDLSDYCQSLEQEGKCLKQASKVCKDEYPKISVLVSTFHAYLNQFCNDKAKLFLDVAPCIESHKAEFQKCIPEEKFKEDPLTEICKEMPFVRCMAEFSKKKCKDGEAFGNALLAQVKDLEKNVCSGATTVFVYNFVILLATVISFFVMKIKI